MNLNLGDLLYDGQYLGMIIAREGRDFTIEWLNDGRGGSIDENFKFQICSNNELLLCWRHGAQVLKENKT